QYQNGTCNGTGNKTQQQNQNQYQNGTCNGTGNKTQQQIQNQYQNGTCEGTGDKTQQQNQEQNQNGTCEGTGDKTQQQNQEQNQDGTCEGTGDKTQQQNQEQNQGGTCEGTSNGKQQQYQEQKNGDSEENEDNKHRWRYQYQYQIQEGIKNGTVVMECNLSKKNGNMYVNSYEYQKGMNVEIDEQAQNRLRIRVTAEFQEGKVLVLNVDKNAFKVNNANQLRVRFDGQEIHLADINDVVNGKGTEAIYAAAIGESGGQYLIYIPHFSEHIITLESLDFADEETKDFLVMAFGAAMVTVIVLILIVVRIGKYRK
ncbi:hypothetical protein, partial [[Eubacterium] cellulosolvens]